MSFESKNTLHGEIYETFEEVGEEKKKFYFIMRVNRAIKSTRKNSATLWSEKIS